MAQDDSVRMAFVTIEPGKGADLVARLVEEKLVACGNVVPGVTSIYRWQGSVEREGEELLVLKTTAGRSSELETRIRELHDYDVPEVLFIDVAAGSADYLAWVAGEVRRA